MKKFDEDRQVPNVTGNVNLTAKIFNAEAITQGVFESGLLAIADDWIALQGALSGGLPLTGFFAAGHIGSEGGRRLMRVGFPPTMAGARELETRVTAAVMAHLNGCPKPNDRVWLHWYAAGRRVQGGLAVGTGWAVLALDRPLTRGGAWALSVPTTLTHRQALNDHRSFFSVLDNAPVRTRPEEAARQVLVEALGCGGIGWRAYRELPDPTEASGTSPF